MRIPRSGLHESALTANLEFCHGLPRCSRSNRLNPTQLRPQLTHPASPTPKLALCRALPTSLELP